MEVDEDVELSSEEEEEEEEREIPLQIRTRFVCQQPAIRVTTDPFAVPTRLGRKGLTDVSMPSLQ